MTVRGITLNARNSDVVTFDVLKNMVFRQGPEEIYVTDPRKFSRDPLKATLITKPMSKRYRVVYTKRRLLAPDYIRTLPFGYKE
jgi:hypothetical protein